MLSYSHTFSLSLSAAIIKHIKQYLNAGALFRRVLYNNRMWMWCVTVTLHLVRTYTLTTYLGLHIRTVILFTAFEIQSKFVKTYSCNKRKILARYNQMYSQFVTRRFSLSSKQRRKSLKSIVPVIASLTPLKTKSFFFYFSLLTHKFLVAISRSLPNQIAKRE